MNIYDNDLVRIIIYGLFVVVFLSIMAAVTFDSVVIPSRKYQEYCVYFICIASRRDKNEALYVRRIRTQYVRAHSKKSAIRKVRRPLLFRGFFKVIKVVVLKEEV